MLNANPTDLTENVFVYGTLRRNQVNHYILARKSHAFLGEGQIHGEVRQSTYGFPCLMEGLGLVSGEIFAVSEEHLSGLDHFECVPSLYVRKQVETTEGLPVWVYFGNAIKKTLI